MRSDEGLEHPPLGPPWSLEALADLHAGVYGETETREALSRIRGDAGAESTLAALAGTRTALARLGAPPAGPVPAVPPDVAARIDAALAAEAAGRGTANDGPSAPLVDLAAARRRRKRFLGWGGGAVAVAAAVAAVALVVLPGTRSTPGHGVAAPPRATAGDTQSRLALGSGELGRTALGKALGRNNPGPFADQRKLRGCLRANAADPNDPATTVLGTAQVTRDGRTGTLFVLTTGKKATFRLLIVGESCSAGNPATIDDAILGPK